MAGDEQVVIDFIGNTKEVDKKVEKLDKDIDRLKNKAADRGGQEGINFNLHSMMAKLGLTAGVFTAIRTGMAVTQGLVTGYQISVAKTNREWEKMVGLEQKFRQDFTQIPVIGHMIIAPIWQVVDLLTGAEQRVRLISEHAQDMKSVTSAIASQAKALNVKVQLSGLSEFKQQIQQVKNETAAFQEEEEKRLRARLVELEPKRNKGVEFKRMYEEAQQALINIQHIRLRMKEISLGALSEVAEKINKEAQYELETRNEIAESYEKARKAYKSAPMSEIIADETKALREMQIELWKVDRVMVKRHEDQRDIANAQGKAFDLEKSIAVERTLMLEEYNRKVQKIQEQNQERIRQLPNERPGARESVENVMQMRRELEIAALRDKGKDTQADLLVIANKYADKLKDVTDQEEYNLNLKMKSLEVARAAKAEQSGDVTVADISTRASRGGGGGIPGTLEGAIRELAGGKKEVYTGKDWREMREPRQPKEWGSAPSKLSVQEVTPPGQVAQPGERERLYDEKGNVNTKLTADNTTKMVTLLERGISARFQ